MKRDEDVDYEEEAIWAPSANHVVAINSSC